MTTVAAVSYEPSSLPLIPRAEDLAEAWLDEITNLYLLCFVPTADKMVADQCFMAAMDDYLGSSASCSGEWARAEGRASVIRRAIQMVRPVPKQVHSWSYAPGGNPSLSDAHQPFAAITSLGAFERFVFVLSVIEGESDDACAILLGCDVAQVEGGRELANRLITAVETDDWMPVTGALLHLRCGIC